MGVKKVFYPAEELESFLESIPKGQFSGRINDLIMKGLTLERQLKIEQDYQQFNDALGSEKQPKKAKNGLSGTMMMSAKLFEPEDETEDFF